MSTENAVATVENPADAAESAADTPATPAAKGKGKGKGKGSSNGSAPALHKPAEQKIQMVRLDQIKSYLKNTRESIPTLAQFGYGFFTPLPNSDRPAIVALAFSDKPDDRKEFCALLEEHEGAAKGGKSLVGLANNISTNGLRSPVELRVRQESDGYDMAFGGRRFLASLYNWLKSGLATVPNIPAIVVEATDEEAASHSFGENHYRLDMSPMEEARHFQYMKKTHNLDYDQIAKECGVNHQTVRGRMALLKLKPEEQEKVHSGDMPYTKAIALLKSRKNNGGGNATPAVPTNTGRGHRGDGSRRKAPTLHDYENWYGTGKEEPREDLKEAVREWMATEVLEVEYQTLAAVKKARAAAAAAENTDDGKGKGKGKGGKGKDAAHASE